MIEFSKIRNILLKVLTVAVIFSAGVYVGFNRQPEYSTAASINDVTTEKGIDLSSFWRVWDLIDEKYPSADAVSEQDRVYGAISGLLGALKDPYSVFFDAEEAKTFEDDIKGNFIGIGIEISNKNSVLTVIAPLKNTPAYKAGVLSGDKITKIDETLTTGLTVEKAAKLIKGEKGTPVKLTIEREGETEPKEITIIRDVINIPTLDAELRSDGIFVIKLYSFSSNSTNLFRNAMKKFSQSKTDKLVLDLRGNPGGYLSAAVDIASWFLPNGKTVVVEDFGKNIEPKVYRSKGYASFSDKFKFVVLVDDGSASASEILAGALQDYNLAKIVGEKSFGKGSVQELVNIKDGTMLKITIAKWLTPNGVSISEEGLTPDYAVPMTVKDKEAKEDPQMDKAVELLKNWK